MRLAIDASNLSIGGGITHLVELLRQADPTSHGFEKIIVWASSATLARIEERPWIEKRTDPALEGHLLRRLAWQRRTLPRYLREAKADLLFAPGGSIVPRFQPAVTMSRNMLPFEWSELRRFGFSTITLKLALLRWSQSDSFKRADGTIFLTNYAFDAVTKVTGSLKGKTIIIPHGVNTRFRMPPRRQRTAEEFTASNPLRVVYVSTIDEFKHQWHVVDAVGRLHQEGLPLRLDLYGSARASTLPRLTDALARVDGEGQFIRYWGAMDYKEIHKCYAAADICVFASSCENMPNILIESMAAGLPIACSNRGPMPEMLGDDGVYFDPENATSIANAVRELATQPQLRAEKASAAFAAASKFSWSRCAKETFSFLETVVREHQEPVAG
ncbi:glycosyltransferase family 4 protein [Bradyrhizobium erythrophlei]|uniref:glycosyltransferase family 4 protein n=1 Tax=Bradyrhizobium erythrophlei TaxID=1437360 RepID=UPI0035E4C45D